MIPRPLLIPLLSLALISMAASYFFTFLSLHLSLRGTTDTVIGLIHSAYYFGLIFGALNTEKVIISVGYIRAFSAFGALLAATILCQSLIFDPILWSIMRAIAGYCVAGLYVSIEGWILGASTNTNRGKYLAIYMVSLYSAQAASQFFIPMFDNLESGPYAFASMLASMSLIPILLSQFQAPQIEEAPVLRFQAMVKKAPFGMLGCFISGTILSALYSFLPIYAKESGHNVSYTMGSLILGGMVLQFVIGKLSDLFDRRKVILCIAAFTVVPCLALTLCDAMWLRICLYLLLGGATFTLYPVSVSQIVDRVEHKQVLSATAIALFSYGVGSVLGPLGSGKFIHMFGNNALFYFVCMMCLALIVSSILSVSWKRRQTPESQEPFTALPYTSTIANELDPRS